VAAKKKSEPSEGDPKEVLEAETQEVPAVEEVSDAKEGPPPFDETPSADIPGENPAPQLSPTESGYNSLGQWVGKKIVRQGG